MQFQDLPIKRKLVAVIFLTSVCVLALTCVVLLTYEVHSFKQSTTRSMSTMADIISANSTAALIFDDQKLAQEILSGLRAEPEVVAAALFDRNGKLYATYPTNLVASVLPSSPARDGVEFHTKHLTLYNPVVQGQNRVGTLFLKMELHEMYRRLGVYGLVLLLVLASSGVVALFLSNLFQRRISQPLLDLANTAKIVSEQKDYSVRAIKTSRDELGYLTEAFNSMLDQIQTSHSALRQSETRLSAVFNQAGAGIAQTDLMGRFLMVNDRYCEITGRSREQLLGLRMQDLTYSEDVSRNMALFEDLLKGSSAFVIEKRYLRPNGDLVWVRNDVAPLRHTDGHIESVLAVTQDITERKLAERAMMESEGRYRQLISSLPAAVYTTDAQGRVTLYNEAAVALWGRTPEVGKDLWCGSYRIFRPDGTILPLDQCPMAVTLKEGRPVRGEEILVERPDGTRRNVLPYPDPIRDASGKLVGAINMLLDITESKRAEEVSRRLASIVESSDDAIISKNLNSIITSWNHGAERLFGYQAEEVIGKPVTILIPPDRWNEEPSIMERIRRGEHIEHYETVRQRKDGRLIDISLTISPIKDARGKVIGASKIGRDITAQNQAKRELERAHLEAVAASRAKDDFLAALSHELRTPLNPVLLLASESAEDPELPKDVREDFDTIAKNVALEARLIDDLLDVTRIARGKLPLEPRAMSVHTVLQDAIATVRADLEQKRIALQLDLEADKHTVLGDPVRLQQVFWNILKNSVKFTAEGGKVTVRTRTLSGNNELLIAVSDNGIGLTSAELTGVFDAFKQGEHALTGSSHKFGGLGLGLAISRTLVELHSGKIQAFSEGRGQGATFTVTLPLLHASEAAPGNGSITPLISKRHATVQSKEHPVSILLVEDHEPTRTALAHLLLRRQYVVKAAASVREAQELAGKQRFDLVLSDIGLPDGNGYDLMKELGQRYKLPGIALTGYGMEHDVARSQDAGFVTHLIKPIKIQSLEAALAAISFAQAQSATPSLPKAG